MFIKFLIVSIGSFFGGGLRFLVSELCKRHFDNIVPWGTLSVNLIGCLISGILLGLSQKYLNNSQVLLLVTGFCGGFTTFSAFMNENYSLISSNNNTIAVLYSISTIIFGLLSVFIGREFAKLFI